MQHSTICVFFLLLGSHMFRHNHHLQGDYIKARNSRTIKMFVNCAGFVENT